MDFFAALVLGILQGITEWLPISSQGQVAGTALALFGVAPKEALGYAIFLHIGTLLAAIVYFRKELLGLLRGNDKKLLKFLGIAVVATAVTAIPSYILLKNFAIGPFILLVVIGLLLIGTGLVQRFVQKRGEGVIGNKNALWLGLGQGFAVLPGVSRSGVTSAVLLFEGFAPEEAFRLSFLLSVPSVLLGELAFAVFEPIIFEPTVLVAVAAAFVVGLGSIKVLLNVAHRINFSWFCVGFGIIYLLIAIFGAI